VHNINSHRLLHGRTTKIVHDGRGSTATWDSAPPERRLMKQPVGRTVS